MIKISLWKTKESTQILFFKQFGKNCSRSETYGYDCTLIFENELFDPCVNKTDINV